MFYYTLHVLNDCIMAFEVIYCKILIKFLFPVILCKISSVLICSKRASVAVRTAEVWWGGVGSISTGSPRDRRANANSRKAPSTKTFVDYRGKFHDLSLLILFLILIYFVLFLLCLSGSYRPIVFILNRNTTASFLQFEYFCVG